MARSICPVETSPISEGSDTSVFENNKEGDTPHAIWPCHRQLLRYTSNEMAENNSFPLHEAARDGQVLIVKGLVGETPNAVLQKDLDGRIPLHWAVSFSHIEIVSILLNPNKFTKEGAKKITFDIDDFTDDSGWTALHIASAIGNIDIVELLLEHDPEPDVNLPTNTGLTPVHLATAKKHLDVIEVLVKKGASVRAKDNKGQQALHRAVSVGAVGIVKYLVEEQKAPLNVKDSMGWTPLHHALAEGFGDIGALLVKSGADPSIEDSNGQTALRVAVDDKVAQFFKSECANNGIEL